MNDSPDEQGPRGLGSDELTLRRMLQDVVQDVAPREGALEQLRRAVPARRARKRQAAVGVAAAALFLGTAVPALVHVSGTSGPDANPSIAGHGSAAQGGSGEGALQGGDATPGGSASGPADGAPGGGTGGGHAPGGITGPGTGPTAAPSAGLPAAPPCTAGQLSAAAESGGPDSTGTVYGSFRVTNISADRCTVGGPGTVTALAQGAADPTRITLARHVAGDAAAGLPDPSLEVGRLVLLPGAAYEVRFAWVPAETCPADSGTGGGGTGGTDSGGTGTGTGGTDTGGSGSGGATPTPTSTSATGTTGSAASAGTGGTDRTATAGESGTSAQLLTADGVAEGGVSVSYTSEAGGPGATATVTGACAGTVYRTGVLSAS